MDIARITFSEAAAKCFLPRNHASSRGVVASRPCFVANFLDRCYIHPLLGVDPATNPAALGERMRRTAEPRVYADEHWITQWVRFGLREFDYYLSRHAAFAAWCAEHDRGGSDG